MDPAASADLTLPTLTDYQTVSRLALALCDPRGSAAEARFPEIARAYDGLDPSFRAHFWNLVERNSLRIQALRAFAALGREEAMPEALRVRAKQERLREEMRRTRVRELLADFHAAGIACIALKGTVIGAELLRDPVYKRMNDFDFLVRWEDAARVVERLRALGYRGTSALFGKKELDPKSHHSPPFYLEDNSCVLGLHWDFLSSHRAEKAPLLSVWERKAAFDYDGVPAYRLAWDDFLLHLCCHLAEAKTGARELADLAMVLRYALPALDVPAFSARMEQWRAADRVFAALSCVSATHADLGERKDLRALMGILAGRASPELRARVRRKTRYGEALVELRTLLLSRIERNFAASRLSPDPRDRFKYWRRMYALAWRADRFELGALRDRLYFRGEKPAFWTRAIAPWRCLKALGKDHGSFLIAVVTALHACSVVAGRIKLMLGRPKPVPPRSAALDVVFGLE